MMTIIEKIIKNHSDRENVQPGDIVDIMVDARIARDYGGAKVVQNLLSNNLKVEDPKKTFFTFDFGTSGSDREIASGQHFCRQYARENNIKVYDIQSGIGTHIAIEEGLAGPGDILVSNTSHANILGAIGALGQGMGELDLASIWSKGSTWFKVPGTVKITFTGKRNDNLSAKDIALNLIKTFSSGELLGHAIELYGEPVERLSLDERITISSMATELGALIILIPPHEHILKALRDKTGREDYETVTTGNDPVYINEFDIDISKFRPMVARPGHPHNDVDLEDTKYIKIDSAFLGSCTNGRMEDLRVAAMILQDNHIAPGVVMKIVPSTDDIWKQALEEGLIKTFKEAGALVSNAGCAGCYAGQVGQNGPDEVTISTGNRNYTGMQGEGKVYLASPATVAASAVSGYITGTDDIPADPRMFNNEPTGKFSMTGKDDTGREERPVVVQGKARIIDKDYIRTDMIFPNRYRGVTGMEEMGQYTFHNLEGHQDFAEKAGEGDIVITRKNFGEGNPSQQAIDCFKALKIGCIIAESFSATYERNAINAAMPILTYHRDQLELLDISDGDMVEINFLTGDIKNITRGKTSKLHPFNDFQMEIYQKGGLLSG
jgi:3-isopropylmalate dehydratase small subunit